MANFFNKFKPGSGASGSAIKKKDELADLTPLDRMLYKAPLRADGSDKFFGLENFGNTWYYLFPHLSTWRSFKSLGHVQQLTKEFQTAPATIRGPSTNADGASSEPQNGDSSKSRPSPQSPGSRELRPEDKPDSPEYKKKQALARGPVLELAAERPDAYGIGECTFTALKDIFTAMIESNARSGVLSPKRFLDIFKKNNETFQSSMHQDAHEFYGLVLNDVITTIENNARKAYNRELQVIDEKCEDGDEEAAVADSGGSGGEAGWKPETGWVHKIFEGLLTSETKCLTCERISQRDETFLDLSIDLEQHSSVTACLKNFSAVEKLCDSNKFYCNECGSLQDAEKRMKVKRLPKVLALHLKRFKYTEDFSRLQKLFHRVTYPYYLRVFNTVDDISNPDCLYELYAVVVHIGGNAYQGHYVSVIKTLDRGWLLFDDEMVEPVDKNFVQNFFGDKPGTACAYLLLYQETTFEKAMSDQDAEGYIDIDVPTTQPAANRTSTQDPVPSGAILKPIFVESGNEPAETSMLLELPASPIDGITSPGVEAAISSGPKHDTIMKRFEQLKEAKAAERARKQAEKGQKQAEKEQKQAEKEQQKQAEKELRRSESRTHGSAHIEPSQPLISTTISTADEEHRLKASVSAGPRPLSSSCVASAGVSPPSPLLPSGAIVSGRPTGLLQRARSRQMSRKSFAFLGKKREEDMGSPNANGAPRYDGIDGRNKSMPTHPDVAAGDRLDMSQASLSTSTVSTNTPPALESPVSKSTKSKGSATNGRPTMPGRAITHVQFGELFKERFSFSLRKKKSSPLL